MDATTADAPGHDAKRLKVNDDQQRWRQRQVETPETEESQVQSLEGEFSHVVTDKQLWLQIVRFLPREDLGVIDDMPELRGMGLLVKAERRTMEILKDIQDRSSDKSIAGVPNPISQLDVDTQQVLSQVEATRTDFWYAWGADKAGFGSVEKFLEFCTYAGVDPSHVIKWSRRRYDDSVYESHDPSDVKMVENERRMETRWHYESFVFLSTDKRVIFVCSKNPTGNDNEEAYVHYFGMTGQRERVKWLASWFHDNGEWDEICYGGRDFI